MQYKYAHTAQNKSLTVFLLPLSSLGYGFFKDNRVVEGAMVSLAKPLIETTA